MKHTLAKATFNTSLKFSVLISIYSKENSENFHRAMESIWDQQTLKPDEIIIVEDGPLTSELYRVIGQWKLKLDRILKVITIEDNKGTGEAKNIGLSHCSYDLIAIMDSDDISLENRFETQINAFLEFEIDCCGSWIDEFSLKEDLIEGKRVTPEFHNEIVKFAKSRSPINHVTAMMKKQALMDAGGYQKMTWFEDYYLFVRLIATGAKLYNIQESLVKVRAGINQIQRRRGFEYAINELKFQSTILKLGFINYFEFFMNLLMRTTLRMLPIRVFTLIYSIIRKYN